MALDFPTSPVLNEEYTSGLRTWVWNGSAWDTKKIQITDTINAADDTSTTTLYPVMVAAAGAEEAIKVTTTKLSFNASTGALAVGGTVKSAGLYDSSNRLLLIKNDSGTVVWGN